MTQLSSTASTVFENDSVTLRGWNDLEAFGINCLTGEACAFSQRMLCDVNEHGKALLAEYFGMPGIQLAAPMNSSVHGQPSVGSLMLERTSWRAVARFALFNDGALGCYDPEHGQFIAGIYSAERLAEYERHGIPVTYNVTAGNRQPRVGSRNVHAFTGRAG